MSKKKPPHIVVVGSGWAGLYIAQYINYDVYSVTVISPRRTSAYTPLLASAACGLFPFSCAEEPIRTSGRSCNFVQAHALDVDFERHKIHCQAAIEDEDMLNDKKFNISYDKLILCPGCQTNTFNTPGVAEHALFIKHVSDAIALRKKLFDQLEKASLPDISQEKIASLLHVAIVGGGPTGVEVTAELSNIATKELKTLYPRIAHLIRISVFDVAQHILGAYEKKLYEYATERMRQHGVQIHTSSIIEKVDDKNLHVKDQGEIQYGILLWVTGNKSISFVDALDVKKTTHGLGRILTDRTLRVLSSERDGRIYDDVFALGDAADIEGCSLPTTAEVAVQKARYLVGELNKNPSSSSSNMTSFQYRRRRLVTYIGQHDGITEGVEIDEAFSGHKAWLHWRSGSLTWTRTWRNWFIIIWALFMNALFGRDLARI